MRANPNRAHGDVLPLVSLQSIEQVQQFALGCDADLGQLISTCQSDVRDD